MLLKFLAQPLQRIGDACGGYTISRVHGRDLLNLACRERGVAGDSHLAQMSRLARSDVEENVDLLGGGVGSGFRSNACAIIAVLLHELADILQGEVKLLRGMKFTELKLGGIDDLVVIGMAGSAFYIDCAHKEIKRSGEGQQHIRAGRSHFGLNVGKAPGAEQLADAFAHQVAVKRLARFLGEHLKQVIAVRHAGQVDGLDDASGVSRHGVEGRRRLGLRFLRRRGCRRSGTAGRAKRNHDQHDE